MRGASLGSAQSIASEGMSKFARLHIHFYECDQRGMALGCKTVRRGSEVGVVVLDTHCVEDGIVFGHAPNDVVLTEGINGILGHQYIRYLCDFPHNPYAPRRVILEKSNPVWLIEDGSPRKRAHMTEGLATDVCSVFTRTNREGHVPIEAEASATPDGEVTYSDEELTLDELSSKSRDELLEEPIPAVKLEAMEGLNPFSGSDRGKAMADQETKFADDGPFSDDGEPMPPSDREQHTDAYTPSPNLGDRVKEAVKEEDEESRNIDVGAITALLTRGT